MLIERQKKLWLLFVLNVVFSIFIQLDIQQFKWGEPTVDQVGTVQSFR